MFKSVPPFWVIGILGMTILLAIPVLMPCLQSKMAG